MLVEAFKTVLAMSAAGGLLILALIILKPITEKRLGAVWQYYIWLAVLTVMLIPISVKLPAAVSERTTERLYQAVEIINFAEIKTVNFTATKTLPESVSFSLSELAAWGWIIIALVVLLYKTAGYMLFKRAVYKNSRPDFKQGRIRVRRTGVLSAPLLMGIFKPVLLIPEKELSRRELKHIMAHELMHYKRCDILYKWLAVFVKCLHWFNPLVYVMAKELDAECEISCDVLLTSKMDECEQKSYMNTVLALIERKPVKKLLPFATMASSKRIIKKRFKMIRLSVIPKVHTRVISAFAALLLCASGVLASTFFLSAVYAEKLPLATEITNIIALQKPEKQEEPDPQQAEVSPDMPRTAEEKIETAEEEPAASEQASVPEEQPMQKIKQEAPSAESYVNMEIIELGEKKNTEEMASLVEKSGSTYTKGSFKYEDGTGKLISGIKPDENGNITLHLYSEAGEIIEIGFSETESRKGVWGVKLPANGNCAYSFTGFDKNKEYSISLYSPAKENWKIDSEYIIY